MLGDFDRLLHLAQDLRLAQHHGIETGRHAEGVLHRFGAVQRVGIGLYCCRLQAMVVRQPFQRGLRVIGVAIELGAVAGGENRCLLHRLVRDEVVQRLPQTLAMESDVLADGEGGGGVVNAEGKQMHDAIFRYRAGLSNNFRLLEAVNCR